MRLASVAIVVLLIASTISGISALAADRAVDSEPDNDSVWGASVMTSGEVVHGDIMLTRADDYYDYYTIWADKGMVVNASLCLLDYDPSYPTEYDLSLYLGTFDGSAMTWVDSSLTDRQWESVSAVAPQSENLYILVMTNRCLFVCVDKESETGIQMVCPLDGWHDCGCLFWCLGGLPGF